MALTLSNARLIDGRVVDVSIDAGVIVDVEPGASGSSRNDERLVDLGGSLLLPAAVEPHAHLDKAFLAATIPNPAGDLTGAIEAMVSHRHLIDHDSTVARAERAARLMAANGFVAVRTHADTTTSNGLASIEALAEVRRRVVDVIDVEIVALCGSPVIGVAGADHRVLLAAAVTAGADLVGGCPHLDGDIPAATDVLLTIAAEHGVGVDLHTDETLDPAANGLEILAERVLGGFALPATAGHCVSLGQQPLDRQRRTADLVAAAGIGVVALPATNLFLQGRGHTPVPRALTAIDVLQAAGVVVAAGADNLQDPFNPLGRACPFETAAMMITAAHFDPASAWRSVSADAAQVIGFRDLGVHIGASADLVAVASHNLREAIAFAPPDRRVWRAGVETTPGNA